MSESGSYLHISSSPSISGGEPCIMGTRLIDLIDRVDAGDSVADVAEDFGMEPGSLELLLQVRDALKPRAAEKRGKS